MSKPRPIRNYVLTPHAHHKATSRGIPLNWGHDVLAAPQQRMVIRPGRVVLQSRYEVQEAGTVYLVRVVVDVDRKPAEVVTVYLTSRISKYWESQA